MRPSFRRSWPHRVFYVRRYKSKRAKRRVRPHGDCLTASKAHLMVVVDGDAV